MSTSRPDQLAKLLIDRRQLLVDTTTGAITKPDGTRAEILDKRMGYGRVQVYTRPPTLAMAHRIVWIAAHGLIPHGLQINHRNRRRWDNRLTNLELVTPTGNSRHWRGYGYDHVGPGGLDPAWLQRLDRGQHDQPELDPYRTPGQLGNWLEFC